MQEIESGAAPKGRDRSWTYRATLLLRGDRRRSADTHLLNPVFRGLKGLGVYLKDESTHPTGSLKHRLAHSLFLYGICNGDIRLGTTVVEASSGSTAVSEAYFAQILGLPFIAVVPRSTSRVKIDAIERFGGRRQFVEAPGEVYETAAGLAREASGHYLDQLTNAERATD
jgi:cysteine synthase A